MASSKPSLCFIARNAYGALSQANTGHFGGVQRQVALMAKWFAAHGHRVDMMTWDEGQPDGVVVDGVRVIKMCRWDAGFWPVRFIHPKWTSLCRAMKRSNADIYYYNCGDLCLGQIVWWSRRHRRKSVYSVASDADCKADLPALHSIRERALYRYGVRHADRIVVQTQRQQRMLNEAFGVSSVVVPMPCDGPIDPVHRIAPREQASAARVLWVGRISEEKRLEWFLDMADRCPDLMFDVVGAANVDSSYASALHKRASDTPNVVMHGRMPHAHLAQFYRDASLLCCTSAYEGFPNTFLEAWSYALPVVSTCDPDGVIVSGGLGWLGRTPNELVSRVTEALDSAEAYLAASQAARQYYLQRHTLDACMARFQDVFQQLVHNRAR